MNIGGSMGGRPRLAASTAILAAGVIGVATGLIPIHGGRSAEDAELASAACLRKVQSQHGSKWKFADDVKVNGGDSPEALVIGTAVHANDRLSVACSTHKEGDGAWRVTSVRTSTPTA